MSTSSQLHILVGTTGDTALHAAQAAAKVLDGYFASIVITLLGEEHGIGLFGSGSDSGSSNSVPAEAAIGKAYIVCSSTYGNGDVPDNAQAFLASFDLEPAYLGHVRYGLMALGDSSYGETYGAGARLIDAKLQDVGAQRVGDIFEHDAASDVDADEAAALWVTTWVSAWQ